MPNQRDAHQWRGRGSRAAVVVILEGQFPPPKPFIMRKAAPAVTICPPQTLGSNAHRRRGGPWMSINSVAPSVMRFNSVTPDWRRVPSYWGAPASTPHVTNGNNVSARTLTLNCEKTSIALSNNDMRHKGSGQRIQGRVSLAQGALATVPAQSMGVGRGGKQYSRVLVRDTYHTQSRPECRAPGYRQKSNLEGWTAHIR